MYTFQEVHEHTAGMGDTSNKTYWKVIHEDTLLWITYYSKGKLPEGTLPWVFDTWVELTDEQRKEVFKMKSISTDDFVKAKKMLDRVNIPEPLIFFGNCTATIPVHPEPTYKKGYEPVRLMDMQFATKTDCMKQEQGNNPMGYNLATATTISTPTMSDEAIQRQYLLKMLEEDNRHTWKEDTKYAELRKLFNIDAPTYPRTTQGLLDAIKNGKFTVDQEKLSAQQEWTDAGRSGWSDYDGDLDMDNDGPYDTFFGLTFTDLPKEDRKGYDLAVKDYELAMERTKRKIIISSPADGLAALEALEAWLPTGKAN